MARGTKYPCGSCGKPFYDLGKDNPVCPNCGQILLKNRALTKRRKSYGKTLIDEVAEQTQSKVVLGRFKNEIFRNKIWNLPFCLKAQD